MPGMLDRLHADHVNIARLLDVLEEQCDLLRKGETVDARMLQDIFSYIAHHPDLYHHPSEDLIFEVLRRCDPPSVESVDALSLEHGTLTKAANEILATLSAISGQAMIPRERLVGMLLDYIARSRRHMSFEESTVFPRARAMVSEQDWRTIERGVPHKEDPLFGGTVSEQYRALYRLIMRESREQ
jgi:hemerythrin-like domain-containing protein